MWTLITGLFVAAVAAVLARELKISEFRQKWIDDLRQDVAAYVSATETWIQLVIAKREAVGKNPRLDVTIKHDPEIAKALNAAFHIASRLRLRIKPTPKCDKMELDFLESLTGVLGAKLTPFSEQSNWQTSVDHLVNVTRELLKREWDVTKYFWRRWNWAYKLELQIRSEPFELSPNGQVLPLS